MTDEAPSTVRPPGSSYDAARSYQWNYDHVPAPSDEPVEPFPGDWTFCGRPAAAPIGVAAGPLLNGAWCRYYASLGWDVLTYKTVRSASRACYPEPNLAPVDCEAATGEEEFVNESDAMRGSWAVSFGMPSATPETWRRDVRQTRESLAPGKLLIVSVVATAEDGWSLDQVADDYARCAGWAIESGADGVEANLSCPNVSSVDGDLYRRAADAGLVAERLRAAVGSAPLLLKIGHLPNRSEAARLIEKTAPHADALNMTNSVAAKVRARDGSFYFGGARRGICGVACREASLRQVALFAEEIARQGADLQVVGTGGACGASDVRRYLDAGAECVQFATAVMTNPRVALEIRRDWPSSSRPD